ncbi:MAG: triphosphoribosyl-dephospho-CoA synthase [Methylococcaceae bacterium]
MPLNNEVVREQLIQAYLKACEVDVLAFKPGNVSVYVEGHDMTVNDFRLSAKVSAEPITDPDLCLGEKIFQAVKETQEAVHCNTNLGIILLAAPLIQAGQNAVQQSRPLRKELSEVLTATTIRDAEWAFQAISLASPGGLGTADNHDVRTQPDVTLAAAMNMAAFKDRIAFQYASHYQDIFDFAILRYNSYFNRWGNENWAAVAVFVGLLTKYPDSHIERKYGTKFRREVYIEMVLLDKKLSNTQHPQHLLHDLYRVDQRFKSSGINPGTTADLTVATLLVANLEHLFNNPVAE